MTTRRIELWTNIPIVATDHDPVLEISATKSIRYAIPETRDDEWMKAIAALYRQQASSLHEALRATLPGGTMHQLMIEMLEHQACLFTVPAIASNNQQHHQLAQRLTQYIHDVETRCDPTGEVQTIAALRDQVRALTSRIHELETAKGGGS